MATNRPTASVVAAMTFFAGCYMTTPHRVEVASGAERPVCEAAVDDVFTRAGFVPMASPRGYNAFFTPRGGSNELRRLRVASGIGVIVSGDDGSGKGCRVILEALSTDGACADEEPYWCAEPSLQLSPTSYPCPGELSTCEMTSSTNSKSDALVDDLGRKLRAALNADPRVN